MSSAFGISDGVSGLVAPSLSSGFSQAKNSFEQQLACCSGLILLFVASFLRSTASSMVASSVIGGVVDWLEATEAI